jgi:[ribosomal protein S18]-alanine N-acetyltransferase
MTAAISIRRFRLSDMERILEIEDACFGVDGYDRKLFAGYSHKCGDLFLVGVIGRNVCGYILACIGGQTGDRAELISVAVDPRRRGKGVATALMDGIIRRIRRRGASRFHLMVKVNNKSAIAMYEKYGFEPGRLVRKYYEDGKDGRQMAKYWN